MPLNQVGSVSVPEPRMLTVQVWARRPCQPWTRPFARQTSASIRSSMARCCACGTGADAGRRQELVKLAHKYAEQSRVAIRNVRREGMEVLKKLEKDGKMSQDDHRGQSAKVQE